MIVNMYEEITDGFICKVICSGEEMIDEIKKKIRQHQLELMRQKESDVFKSEAIYVASMPGQNDVRELGKTNHDLHDVMSRYHHLLYEQQMNEKKSLELLNEKLETINRIRICVLYLSSEEEETIFFLYRVPNAYKKGVGDVMRRYNTSEATVKRWRRSALKKVKELYSSEKSNTALLEDLKIQ